MKKLLCFMFYFLVIPFVSASTSTEFFRKVGPLSTSVGFAISGAALFSAAVLAKYANDSKVISSKKKSEKELKKQSFKKWAPVIGSGLLGLCSLVGGDFCCYRAGFFSGKYSRIRKIKRFQDDVEQRMESDSERYKVVGSQFITLEQEYLDKVNSQLDFSFKKDVLSAKIHDLEKGFKRDRAKIVEEAVEKNPGLEAAREVSSTVSENFEKILKEFREIKHFYSKKD
jgi:hypothetical protein